MSANSSPDGRKTLTQKCAGGVTGFGTLEVWNIKAGGKGWSHPVHVHFEEGIILSRGGKAPPEWEKWARKDVYRIGEGMSPVPKKSPPSTTSFVAGLSLSRVEPRWRTVVSIVVM